MSRKKQKKEKAEMEKSRATRHSTITPDKVAQLASLSRLTFTADQEKELTKDLSSILDYFSAVAQLSDDVQLDKNPQDANRLRPDEVGPSDPEGVLKGVPQKRGRLVRAPRVF